MPPRTILLLLIPLLSCGCAAGDHAPVARMASPHADPCLDLARERTDYLNADEFSADDRRQILASEYKACMASITRWGPHA